MVTLINRPFTEARRGQALPAWAEEIDCRSWPEFLLKFILSHPAVTCVIPGTSRPAGRHRPAARRGLREKMAAYVRRL